jgi:putative membrane protein
MSAAHISGERRASLLESELSTPQDRYSMSTAPEKVSTQKAVFGGVLMGLANLVPGVSGGTLILAVGLYDRFIGAVARCSRLKPTAADWRFIIFLGMGVVFSVLALSGPAVNLVTHSRWVAYSAFIGLTLGGVPMLTKEVSKPKLADVCAYFAGFGFLAWMSYLSQGSVLPKNAVVFFIVGVIGASSMVLPGISGSYVLVLCGLYEVIIGALRPAAFMAAPSSSIAILIPFGAGVLVGVGLFSNLIRSALERRPRITHSVLLGLLVGSTLALWPFQEPAHPFLAHERGRAAVVDLLEGTSTSLVNEMYGFTLTEELVAQFEVDFAGQDAEGLEELGREYVRFSPSTAHLLKALGLCILGFLFTSRLARNQRPDASEKA